ncbi:NADH dehydrogenase [ubiquinone] iron-sulfur protein 5 [Chrysemys picta bellii]|uniref:NADH dehydrogenase [ubiquinone] iron-sulfur protein 5 n=1 Tax=Chrysemys picta bellii TaxID=8478 RepID=A0A8C3FV34_CHRPI|nr:NADH dehydrogenase [ubiquinone] iron-sulfur protein 5 [Chrysemys picta bellii]
MPFWNLQDQLGLNVDKWMLHQSSEQPYKRAALCHAFEKEWIECANDIGQIRAHKECRLEYEDLQECVNRRKTIIRLMTIVAQKKQLIKEGKYTPPEHHSGKPEARP